MPPRSPAITHKLVARLDAAIAKARPDYIDALPAGASDAAIAAGEKKLGLELPETLRALLRWHDGSDGEALVGDLSLCSLQDIVELKRDLDRLDGKSERPGQWWHPQWIPFLDSGGYDTWGVDLHGSFGGKRGQIVHWVKDGAERIIEFDSLDHWLETLAMALDKGLYDEDDDSWFDAADRIRDRLCRGYPKVHDPDDSDSDSDDEVE